MVGDVEMPTAFSSWTADSEFRNSAETIDDLNWRIAASKLALDNQLRRKEKSAVDIQRRPSFAEALNPDKVLIRPLPQFGNLEWRLGNISTKNSLMALPENPGSPATDRWFKTLPSAEVLPRNEILGGYIFVCNNDTMQEDLRRQLFVKFQAASFGGSNIDPTAWEDKKCKGESRFPAQVRIRIKKRCKPLEEDAFRPILYHYDGPKFRLQLSVPEVAIALLDLFTEDDK
ncbi:B2 protein [Nymphaea thermarum]|nr:B2 protein [Nymphaea thermarum]